MDKNLIHVSLFIFILISLTRSKSFVILFKLNYTTVIWFCIVAFIVYLLLILCQITVKKKIGYFHDSLDRIDFYSIALTLETNRYFGN